MRVRRSTGPRAFTWRALLFACGAGCGVDTIVLTRDTDAGKDAAASDAGLLAPDAAQSDAAATGRRCTGNTDCTDDELCEKPDCATAEGACVRRPLLCDDEPLPVCGCDRITYYNDCIRRSEGVVRASASECTAAPLACNATTPCPNGGYCAYLVRSELLCGPAGDGTCWLLPAQCVEDRFGGDRFAPCAGPADCVDACTAIKRETPHVLLRRCDRPGDPMQPF